MFFVRLPSFFCLFDHFRDRWRRKRKNEFLSFGFHRGERLVGPLVWLLAAKLQGKQFGALISFWWTLLGWRRRRSWGRLLEWAKKKKVHVYNQHQPPIWFLLSAIFFYFIPLQSTEAHKTRHSKGFFQFLTSVDIPAHLWLWSISLRALLASFLCIRRIFVFHFGQNEKKSEGEKAVNFWQKKSTVKSWVVNSWSTGGNFRWWRDKMRQGFVELISFKDNRKKKESNLWTKWRKESISVELFSGTHTKQEKSPEMGFWKKTWAFNAAGGSSPRFHWRQPPREDEEEEVAVLLSLFTYCCCILPSSWFCTVYERRV